MLRMDQHLPLPAADMNMGPPVRVGPGRVLRNRSAGLLVDHCRYTCGRHRAHAREAEAEDVGVSATAV